MKANARKSPFRAVAAMMSIVILVGCGWWFRGDLKEMLGPKEPHQDIGALSSDPLRDKEVNLKVQILQYGDFEQIRKPFIIRHPSVGIDTLPIYGKQTTEQFEQLVEKDKPDVMMLPMNLFIKLSTEGKLKSLDSLIVKEKFDLSGVHKPLVDTLREAGGGELYGLTTEFDSNVLYINKDLFEASHIPLPEEGISLADILKTAARFQGTGTVGLAAFDRTNPSLLASLIGESSGLQAISQTDDKLTATLQTKGWENVWTQIAQGYKEGWINSAPPLDSSKRVIYSEEILKSDLFATGKAAMMISDVSYYAGITDYENHTKKGMNWSTVSYHIDASAANASKYLNIPFVYAINAKTTNPEAAWELLSYIGGSQAADRYDSVMDPKIILSRPAAMKSAPEPKWQAFYNMGIDPQLALTDMIRQSDSDYSNAYQQFNKLAGEQMNAVIKGTVTVDQALGEVQQQLEALLRDINNRGEGKK